MLGYFAQPLEVGLFRWSGAWVSRRDRGNTSPDAATAQEPGVDLYVQCKRKGMAEAMCRNELDR